MEIKRKSEFYFIFKRLFDFISSILFFAVFSPLFILILLINCFCTKGHPFYVDMRVGKNGKILKLIKFRSMYIDAETCPEKYFGKEEYEMWKKERKVENDPRITKFGAFLRKSSLDELPQIFNIIMGSMSIVGPRPLVQTELKINYNEEQQKVFMNAKPGLISNWGVNGRNNITYDTGERQRLELEYYSKRSLWYDFKLIIKAVFVVLSRKGAR